MDDSRITQAIFGAQAGDAAATERLWRAYFDKLVGLARRRLTPGTRRDQDEEDIALSALDSFFRRAEEGAFPDLKDRSGLWKLLVAITVRKANAHHRYVNRQIRGKGHVRGESVFHSPNSPGLAAAPSSEPSPELVAEVGDTLEHLLAELPNDSLRKVARMKIEGFTHDQIAGELDCVTKTVQRKLDIIREIWESALESQTAADTAQIHKK